MSSVRVGLVGCGAVGQMHLKNLKAMPDVEVVAVADLRPKLRELVANDYLVGEVYSDHKEMLDKSEIDAAILVTHRHHSAGITADCLRAGKHVFTEKPVAMNLEIAEHLKFMAIEAGRALHVGYQRRADAGVRAAHGMFKQFMESREYGALRFVRSWNFTGRDRDPDNKPIMTDEARPDKHTHRFDNATNILVHDVNLLNLFLHHEKTVEFSAPGIANLLYDGHIPICMSWGFNEFEKFEDRYPWDEGLEFRFDRAVIEVYLGGPLIHGDFAKVKLLDRGGPRMNFYDKNPTPFQVEMREFIDAVKSKNFSIDRINQAVEDMRLLEKILK